MIASLITTITDKVLQRASDAKRCEVAKYIVIRLENVYFGPLYTAGAEAQRVEKACIEHKMK